MLPQASAGAISSAGIVYGQFHGVITPITPRGRRKSSTRLPGENEFGEPPLEPLAVLGRVPPVLHELVDLVVAPRQQRLALVERQRARELVAAPLDHVATRCIAAARSNAVARAQPSAARFAAAIARCASSRVALRDLADRLARRRATRP